MLRELDEERMLATELCSVIHCTHACLDWNYVSQVKLVVKVRVKVQLKLSLALHEGIDVFDHLFEAKANVFPPKVTQLNRLPVLHVVKPENN